MSSSALNLVWGMSEPKGTDRMILIALADHAGHDGVVSVPVRRLAECAGISKTTAAEAMSRLQRDGHIAVIDHGASPTKSPTYRIIFGQGEPDTSAPTADTAPVRIVPAAPHKPKPDPAPTVQATSAPTPTPRPKESLSVAKGHPETLVGEILTAARIPPPQSEPFRWFARRHYDAAEKILDLFNGDKARMAEALARLKVGHEIISLNPILAAARERMRAASKAGKG